MKSTIRYNTPIFFIVVFLLNSGCHWFNIKQENNDRVLAEAYDDILLESEIPFSKTEQALSKQDSLAFIKSYINSWIENKVILEKASINVDPEYMEELQQKVNDYRNALLTFEYEKKLIQQNIDTVVSEEEIQDYYQKNIENFKLRDHIVRCLFIKINKNSDAVKEFLKHYSLKTTEDTVFIMDMAKLEAEKYLTDLNTWRKLDYVLSELPMGNRVIDQQTFVKGHKFLELEDNQYIYLINILEYKLRGADAPASYIHENIKLMILNKRKYAYLNGIRKKLIETAISKNEVTIYEK